MVRLADVPDLQEFLHSDAVHSPFLAVLGHPVAHSLSPLIHNAAFEYYRLALHYHAVDVPSRQYELLPELFAHPNFSGCNVTLPLKSRVVKLLSTVSEKVGHTQACNTIYRNPGGNFAGENTDIDGFLRPLQKYASSLNNSSALVFGTGGAASAIIYALESAGVHQITQFSRTPCNHQSTGGPVRLASYAQMDEFFDNALLLVNCTPLGMHPNIDQCPVPAHLMARLAGKICYDIVYRPRITRFLHEAKLNGAVTIDGTAMFMGQAAEAFRLFTGKRFPEEIVKPLLDNALKNG